MYTVIICDHLFNYFSLRTRDDLKCSNLGQHEEDVWIPATSGSRIVQNRWGSNSTEAQLAMDGKARFFYFSFYRSSRPNFLKIEKKNERIFFFQFYFCISSDSCQYSSGVHVFVCVFFGQVD